MGTRHAAGRSSREEEAVIHVRIASLSVDAVTNQPVIVLKPTDEDVAPGHLLPIWIGHPEATAILLALQGMEPPRPMTHDLLKNVVDTLHMQVERVEITRVDEGTFYAAIILRGEEQTLAIDARPSDSIALAVRTYSPIFVADDVLEEAAVEEILVEDEEDEVERFREFIDHVDPDDFKS
jgi:bifunctional DNase/RNase